MAPASTPPRSGRPTAKRSPTSTTRSRSSGSIWAADSVEKIASEPVYRPGDGATLRPAWSPDSKWIVYALGNSASYHTIYAYELARRSSRAITDGLSDAGGARLRRRRQVSLLLRFHRCGAGQPVVRAVGRRHAQPPFDLSGRAPPRRAFASDPRERRGEAGREAGEGRRRESETTERQDRGEGVGRQEGRGQGGHNRFRRHRRPDRRSGRAGRQLLDSPARSGGQGLLFGLDQLAPRNEARRPERRRA